MASIKLEELVQSWDNKYSIMDMLWARRDPTKTENLHYDGYMILYGSTKVALVNSRGSFELGSKLANNSIPDTYYTNPIDRINSVRGLLGVDIDFTTTTKADMLFLIERNRNSCFFNYAIYKYNSTRDRANRIKVKDIRAHMSGKGGCAFSWTVITDSTGEERRFISANWMIDAMFAPEVRRAIFEQGYMRETEFGPRDQAPCEILSYNTKVEDMLSFKQSNNTLFGIELELENATPANIKIVHDHLKKHAIMKRDGSLQNGVEIVSIPSSIEHHKEMYKPFFDSQHSLTAKANCGIHIHASKTNMSFLAIGRMLKFLAKNKANIVKIAGRTSDQYAAIRPEWDVTSPWYSATEKYSKTPRFNWSKYTGMNILPNRTAEFRIFKSTTNFEEFCRFLEFTESFIQYNTLAGDDNRGKIRKLEDMFEFSNYADFVTNRAAVWPALAKFIRTL